MIASTRHRILAGVVFAALTAWGTGCAPKTYPYLVKTNDCNCEEFVIRDGGVTIRVHAVYRMDNGVVTGIGIAIANGTRDTVSTAEASVRVTSLNVSYQYNNRFLPVAPVSIPPGGSHSIAMEGRDVGGVDDWHLIAGERLTLTLRGIRCGSRELDDHDIVFVPLNPKLLR